VALGVGGVSLDGTCDCLPRLYSANNWKSDVIEEAVIGVGVLIFALLVLTCRSHRRHRTTRQGVALQPQRIPQCFTRCLVASTSGSRAVQPVYRHILLDTAHRAKGHRLKTGGAKGIRKMPTPRMAHSKPVCSDGHCHVLDWRIRRVRRVEIVETGRGVPPIISGSRSDRVAVTERRGCRRHCEPVMAALWCELIVAS